MKLQRLTQQGTIREYVREFSELMLQISDLGEKESFFSFMDGLKPWAKQELQRRGVQDLTKAMTIAESLIELGIKKSDKFESFKPKGKGNGGGDKDQKFKNNNEKLSTGKPRFYKPWDKKKEKELVKCFLCDGPHRMRDCPKRTKLSSINKEDDEPEKETLKLGSIMSSIKAKKCRKQKGLMFVDISIAGRKISALVDTGASDLFLSEDVAKNLNLKVEKTTGWIKTVNSKEVPTMGVAKAVDL